MSLRFVYSTNFFTVPFTHANVHTFRCRSIHVYHVPTLDKLMVFHLN
jgi:hypothetical protein